jgi:hypothetical protein
MPTHDLDPLKVNERLYRQIAKLLDQLEAGDEDAEGGITIPQRINALIAVGRVQIMFANLRKAAANESGDPGSEVRKYSAAFSKANGARRGKASSGAGGFIPVDRNSDDDGDGDDAA